MHVGDRFLLKLRFPAGYGGGIVTDFVQDGRKGEEIHACKTVYRGFDESEADEIWEQTMERVLACAIPQPD
jgi:hypothetical protein